MTVGVAMARGTGGATDDQDIVVRVAKRYSPLLIQALMTSGARPTAVEMRLLFEKRFIRLRTDGPKLDVMIAATHHDRAAFDQAPFVQRGTMRVRLARPEDLILYNLQAWRPQDQADIHALLHAIADLDLHRVLARSAHPSDRPPDPRALGRGPESPAS